MRVYAGLKNFSVYPDAITLNSTKDVKVEILSGLTDMVTSVERAINKYQLNIL